jgi:hypothetical protein
VLIRIFTLILLLPVVAHGEWHLLGYGGFFSRVQPERLELATFRTGPTATTTPMAGFGGGGSIWKVLVDGSLLVATAGESNVFIGPARQVEQRTNGHALMAEGGAGWPLLRIAGFETSARAGYGATRLHLGDELPFEEDRRFWTYGLAATRRTGSRFILRVDARSIQFGKGSDTPYTLGRFNIAVLGGFGLRF